MLHRALLEAGEPVKASEVAKLVPNDKVDLRLARVILATHPNRFTSIDRKWTLWSRFAGEDRPLERNLEEIMQSCGVPAPSNALARELAALYDRPAEIYENMLSRMLPNSDRYFHAGDENYGLESWLL